MNLITLRITPYKDKDIIVNAVSEEGPITFKVMGALAANSKHAFLSSPLLVGNALIEEAHKSKHNILKEFDVKLNVYKVNANLDYLLVVQGLAEITNSLVLEEELGEIYLDLYNSLSSLKNNVDPKLVLIKYLINVTSLMGYELNVRECIRCGSKKSIAAFSFTDGGFICKNCLSSSDSVNLSVNQMLLLRSLLLIKDYEDLNALKYSKDDLAVLYHQFDYFVQDCFDIKLNALKI